MRLAILVIVTEFCAGAAYGQEDQCRNGPIDKAKEAFVVPYTAASAALTDKDWKRALTLATQTRPHAMSGNQIAAVIQIQVAAIRETGDRLTFEAAMQGALEMPCLAEPVRNSYAQQLAELRGEATASPQ